LRVEGGWLRVEGVGGWEYSVSDAIVIVLHNDRVHLILYKKKIK